jgi:hypothetical protein
MGVLGATATVEMKHFCVATAPACALATRAPFEINML